MEQLVPHLREITRPVAGIEAETPVADVVAAFRADPGLLALPVTERDGFLGVVNRRVLFFRHLGKPFAMDLYARKPVRELVDERHVAMAPEMDINAALARLLQVDPTLETDSFPIVEKGRCLGIVSVADLMMKHAESQARLLDALNRLSERIRTEVEKASRIQQALLPPADYEGGGVAISAGVVTSSEIGGDFYDFFPLGWGRIGLVVGDVSGHGVQSGMVTTAAKASLHSLIAQGVTTPGELLHGMNNAILATVRQSLLMTCLVAVVDRQRGELTLANAGHNFPYLCREGGARMITEVSGFPLGFEENATYGEFTTPIAGGDTIVLYSDGIVECEDRRGEEFGYERLEAFLRWEAGAPPRKVREGLFAMVAAHAGTGSFEDDVTLLIATCTGDAPA